MDKRNPRIFVATLLIITAISLSGCIGQENNDQGRAFHLSEDYIRMVIGRILTWLEVGPLVNEGDSNGQPSEITRVTAEPDLDEPMQPEAVTDDEPPIVIVVPSAPEDEPPATQPEYGAVEGIGQVEETGFGLQVYKGNPATFSNPPTVYYANAAEYPSAPGGVVSYSAETSWSMGPYLSVRGRGAWMQLESTEPVTAMGVLLWGDHADGFVQVYIDDTLIWSGDTYFANCNFETAVCEGAFDYYVEASGLESGIHRIRVVNATDDKEATVWFFGIGKVKP